jgi:hypothetical protein
LEHLVTLDNVFKHLKPTIQKVANFWHFANFGREQRLWLSNCSLGDATFFFLAIILSRLITTALLREHIYKNAHDRLYIKETDRIILNWYNIDKSR